MTPARRRVPFRLRRHGLPALGLLFGLAPAASAQGFAGVMACFGEMSPEDFAGRFEAYADARNFDSRMAGFCARGDTASAQALAADIEAGFLAADPVAAAVRSCLAAMTEKSGDGGGDVCDAMDGG